MVLALCLTLVLGYAAGAVQQAASAAPTDAGALAGIVQDETTGAGMGRVVLALTDATGTVRYQVSRGNGAFRFERLPSGRYRIVATKPGYLSMAYGTPWPETPGPSVGLASGQVFEDMVIALRKTSAIAGTITDEHGDGLPNVEVLAVPSAVSEAGAPGEYRAVTDRRGAYRVGGLAPGEYFVAATVAETAAVRARLMREAEIEWFLQQLARGVRDGFEPWPGQAASEPPVAVLTTYYPGTSTVAAAAPVAVGPADEIDYVDISVRRVPVPAVGGVVEIPPGDEVAFADVALIPRHGALHGRAYTATALPPRGFQVDFGGVTPGSYVVVTRGTRHAPAERGADGPLWSVFDLEVPAGGAHELRIPLQPSTHLAGRVQAVGPGSDVDVSRWRVVLKPHDPWLAGSMIREMAATSDESGRFELGNLAPVRYDVTIGHDQTPRQGWRPATATAYGADVLEAPLTARPDVATDLVVTVTGEDARLVGHLETAASFSPLDFRIVMFPRDPALRRSGRRVAEAPVGPTGDYEIRGLPGGEYLLALLVGPPGSQELSSARMDALAASAVPVTLESGMIVRQDIAMAGGGSLTR